MVDYKTTTEILTSHKVQVQEYKNAIAQISNTKDVDGYLIYLKKMVLNFEGLNKISNRCKSIGFLHYLSLYLFICNYSTKSNYF